VIVVLHDLDEALRFSDAAVLLQAGRVAVCGTAANVIASGPVREVYGVDLVPDDALGFREAP
jgi:iron complex transport system ATP-binding protein